MKSVLGTLMAALMLLALPVRAHHSYAMFDREKQLTLRGTVREFQWTNPHCFIQVLVPSSDGHGTTVEWSVEMGAPPQLIRAGWKRDSVKPGDKISVVIYPLRDGSNGGGFVSAATSEGRPIGGGA